MSGDGGSGCDPGNRVTGDNKLGVGMSHIYLGL